MNKLNFLTALSAVTLTPNPTKEVAVKEGSTRSRVEKNPTNGADFRILDNGKIYPSQAFVTEFGLEYQPKNSNLVSNGLDIFASDDWGNYPTGGPRLLLGYITRQDQPKVELFAGTRYKEETNEPINSVMEQGTVVSAETLNLIATTLGYTADGEGSENPRTAWEVMLGDRRYVDFYLVREAGTALVMPDGIYNIPKSIDRGERKGQMTTVRRERITIMPIVEYTEEVRDELNNSTQESTDIEVGRGEGEEVEASDLVRDTETADEAFERVSRTETV